MGTFRINALHWAAGALLAVFGALVLVAPNQFAVPAYAPLQQGLALWGVSFLVVGIALIVTVGADAGRPWSRAARLAAAAVLILLAAGFWRARGWTGVVVYGVLALGCIVASLRLPRRQPQPDLLALVVAVSSVLNGVIILGAPDQFTGVFYDQMRAYLPWNGGAFLVGGLALLAAALLPRLPRGAIWAGHLLAAAGFWLWVVTNALPLWVLTGIVYYGGGGAVVAALPWLGPRLERLDLGLLRFRLGLALALSAALPLILTLAIVTQQQEEHAIGRALASQQAAAGIVAQDIGSYIRLHQGAVQALAQQPGFTALPPAEQLARLRAAHAAFPDFAVLQSFDARGVALARTDGRPLSPPADTIAMFRELERTGRPSVALMVGRVLGRPIVVVGAPSADAAGRFGGIVIGAIDSERLGQTLARVGQSTGAQVMLVDGAGRLIAQPGAPMEQIFSDRSASPAVATMEATGAESGATRAAGPAGETIAGYARVPGLGWAVVVEQPARAALAGIYDGRNLAFAVLALLLAMALAAGAGIAYQLTRPLSVLAVAAEQFADQQERTPLPASAVREVAHLTAIFAAMRERLAARTAERDTLYDAERDARQQAEHAVRMRDVFLSIAAHELRNPLAALIGNAQLLRRRRRAGDTLSERDERALDAVVAQGQRLDRLIGGMLDLSRLEQGQLQLRKAPLDLHELAGRVVADLRASAHRHTLTYAGPAGALTLIGDETRLEQILLNLVQNAIRYSPEGGAVTVRLAAQQGEAILSVSDEGIGIPAADLPRLFQRFARASNAEAQQIEGTGLGLYVVSEIVRLHGGSVGVASVEGAGSTFTVTLPLHPHEAQPPPDAVGAISAAEGR